MFEPQECAPEHGILQLNRAERLLVVTLRRLVLGVGLCAGAMRELTMLCGPHAGEVLVAVRGFLCALDRSARRKVTVAPPGGFGPTADEWRMLGLLSAAQARDEVRLAAFACWFAPRDLQPLLAQASYALADVLAARNLRIATTCATGTGVPPVAHRESGSAPPAIALISSHA